MTAGDGASAAPADGDAGLAGAGGDAGTAPWRGASCEATRWQLAQHVEPASPLDYLSVRAPLVSSVDGERVTTSDVRSEVGEVCGGAQDRALCLELVDAEVASQSGGLYFLATIGDQVQTWDSEEARTELFGPIDTHDEALFVAGLAQHDGYNYEVGCGRAEARQLSQGFEVRATVFVEHCSDAGRETHRLNVEPDGQVTLVTVEQVEPTECPLLP